MLVPEFEKDPEKAAHIIYDALISDKPCMIARFGNNEIVTMCNYLGVKSKKRQYLKIIKRETYPWWWESFIINQMNMAAGFFPPTIDKYEQFSEMMLEEIKDVDILGSWLGEERYFEKEMRNVVRVDLELLNPFFSKFHWTKALEGKKVLVVHPFASTIEAQYKIRELLFADEVLPSFELKTFRSVLSLAGNKTGFNDWFEALEYMKSEISKIDFDICLIGCGAYGFPLAAHAKRKCKKAIHMGGALQLMFGIRGKRWEDENYGANAQIPKGLYTSIINESWVRPSEAEHPRLLKELQENSCYW